MLALQITQSPTALRYKGTDTDETIRGRRPPLNTWGREFVLADTYRIPEAGQPEIPDVYRVMVGQNQTVVTARR